MKYLLLILIPLFLSADLFSQKIVNVYHKLWKHSLNVDSFKITDGVYYLTSRDTVKKARKHDDDFKYRCSYTRYRSGIIKNILDASIIIDRDTVALSEISFIGNLKTNLRIKRTLIGFTLISYAVAAVGFSSLAAEANKDRVVPTMVTTLGIIASATGTITIIKNGNNGYNLKPEKLWLQIDDKNEQ